MIFRDKPWVRLQYDPDLSTYSEHGSESGAKLDISSVSNPDVLRVYEASRNLPRNELWPWLLSHAGELQESTVLLDTGMGDIVRQNAGDNPQFFFSHKRLNRIRHLNTFLNRVSETLPEGGYFMCHATTAMLKKKMILDRHSKVVGWFLYFLHYLWHRVCPKLKLTKWFYFWVTKGRNRTYHRVEVMGRLYRAGFEVVDEGFRFGEFFVLARKVKAPIWDDEPSCGPLIKLPRVSKGGNIIGVYKFRTMYSYSEYLQPYMYEHGGLREGGKFADDYRVNEWGRVLRSCWLDELPMFINFFKGQLKLVGVRPLSRHYFSLYTPEMQKLRIQVKPGLFPPFYYEKESPKTVEEVQDSERRYIEAYLRAPFRTDCRYFFGSIANILFHRKRSH
ncbi:MAG: sugar transferase [Bacteroidales bacterium]|nr:sugar transferase [Bacteroidales bacterium]